MRALWSDKPHCSHNLSQKVKRIRRFSECLPFARGPERHLGHAGKRKRKVVFLRYPRIRIHPHLLNPHLLGDPSCFKPGRLQFLCGSALLHFFVPFCALLRLFALFCKMKLAFALFALICVFCASLTVVRTTAFGNCRICSTPTHRPGIYYEFRLLLWEEHRNHNRSSARVGFIDRFAGYMRIGPMPNVGMMMMM